MTNYLRKILKNILPPCITKALIALRNKDEQLLWSGNYACWDDARKASSGYDDNTILEKVKNALLQVRDGKAAFERDSVLFYEPEYNWPLLASLLWIAGQNKNKLHILDFGGSLGSSYFQHKNFFAHLEQFSWNVVEQPHYVASGKEHFQNEYLQFYDSIEAAHAHQDINVVVLAGVLQYLEDPFDIISHVKDIAAPYILVDRTVGALDKQKRITIQSVPAEIYKASYASWLFNEESLIHAFQPYRVITAFPQEILTDEAYTFGCLLQST